LISNVILPPHSGPVANPGFNILGDKDFLYTDVEKLELQRIAKELKVKIY